MNIVKIYIYIFLQRYNLLYSNNEQQHFLNIKILSETTSKKLKLIKNNNNIPEDDSNYTESERNLTLALIGSYFFSYPPFEPTVSPMRYVSTQKARWGHGGICRVLVPLAFKLLILILMSIHNLFNICQNGFVLFPSKSLSPQNYFSFPNITEREYYSTCASNRLDTDSLSVLSL